MSTLREDRSSAGVTRGEYFVDVGGLKLHCRVEGADAGPWIMFSNSLLTDLSLWDEQAAALRDRFRIIRYDQRGHGRSGTPGTPCTFGQLADDIVAILDEFKISAANYVGISMGAATGINLAARYPQRVANLILCDGAAKSAADARALWDERIAFARAHGMSEFAEITVRRWFRPEAVEVRLAGVDKVRQMVAATSLEGFVTAVNALQDYDLSSYLPRLGARTAVFVGSNDGVLPDVMRKMSEAIPASRFQIIQSAGHLINVEQPVAFNRALQEFLSA